MFKFFKKKKEDVEVNQPNFEIELTAAVLAYEIARSDGEISEDELSVLMEEIGKISMKVGAKRISDNPLNLWTILPANTY